MAWTKTSPWGDYKDPLQNHKFDGDLHFINKDSNEVKVFTRIVTLLKEIPCSSNEYSISFPD